jgi:mono/diheme cytochrome c family protein
VWLLGGVVVLLALAGLPAGAGAAQEEAAQQEDSEALKAAKGRVTFRVYCSNCHGADAKGDGKLAPLLSVKPADLTRLVTAKDKGEFPAERVRQSIDGRAEVAGHGYREMPVWGDVFQPMDTEMSEPEKVEVAKRKIAELVAYLRTIQAPAAEGGG